MSLFDRIRDRIEAERGITVAEYMEMALTDPEEGYYTTRTPLGSGGDFVTAPEVSQVFGELLGIWFAEVWRLSGRPRMELIELGPGLGTLMADLLRATARIDGFHEAITVTMVEVSPVLAARQQQALAGKHPHIRWLAQLPEPEGTPWLVIGNEFFDALPIRQFIATGTGFRERLVSLTEDGQALAFTTQQAEYGALPGDFPRIAAQDVPEGAIIETCPDGQEVMHHLASHIASAGGAGLFIDYGYTRPKAAPLHATGDTLQAVRSHQYHHVLDAPGSADLTAHVDFTTLAEVAVASGAYTPPVITQQEFLLHMGAAQRVEQLLANAKNDRQREMLASGFHRLTSPEEMGRLFKVLAVLPAGLPAPIFTETTGDTP